MPDLPLLAGRRLDVFLPDMDRLKDTFRLIYYDQRGPGKSADNVRPEDVTLVTDLNDIDRVRQHFGLNSVVLLGHSWGTVLALEYALRHPTRVSDLILMNPAPASRADLAAFRKIYLEKIGLDKLCTKKSLSLRSRRKHKAWGASPRIRSSKDMQPVKTGDSVKFQSFARYRGLPLFLFGTLTWGLRPRLYAYACYRRLRNIFGFDFMFKAVRIWSDSAQLCEARHINQGDPEAVSARYCIHLN